MSKKKMILLAAGVLLLLLGGGGAAGWYYFLRAPSSAKPNVNRKKQEVPLPSQVISLHGKDHEGTHLLA